MIFFKYNIFLGLLFLFFYKMRQEKDASPPKVRRNNEKASFFFRLFPFFFLVTVLTGQERYPEWQLPTSVHPGRLALTSTVGGISFVGGFFALEKIWYSQYQKSNFHFFDDRGEWNDMDKYGHVFAAWMLSNQAFQTCRWTGLKNGTAAWTAAGISLLTLGTMEILDGFSARWGFSPADMGCNIVGAAFFTWQQITRKKQSVRLKYSLSPPSIPDRLIYPKGGGPPVSLTQRSGSLFGKSLLHRILKDYNAQTIWVSIPVHPLFPALPNLPEWLNLAAGVGAGNLFGGFENQWKKGNLLYQIQDPKLDRFRQYFFSVDINWEKLVRVKPPLLRLLLQLVNFLKIPAPTLEINTHRSPRFHLLYF